MRYRYLLFGLLVVSNLSFSAVKYSATGCVDSTGNPLVDRNVAKAVAKGQLSHELGGKVSATSQLKTVTTEDENDVQTKDVLTESVTLKSVHMIRGVQTLEEGYQDVAGNKQYCVRLGI